MESPLRHPPGDTNPGVPRAGWDAAPALLAATPGAFWGLGWGPRFSRSTHEGTRKPKPRMLLAAPAGLPHVPHSQPSPGASAELGGKVWAGRSLASPSPRRKSPPPRPGRGRVPPRCLRGSLAEGLGPKQATPESGGGSRLCTTTYVSPLVRPVPELLPPKKPRAVHAPPGCWGKRAAASCQSARSRGRAAAERGVCTK